MRLNGWSAGYSFVIFLPLCLAFMFDVTVRTEHFYSTEFGNKCCICIGICNIDSYYCTSASVGVKDGITLPRKAIWTSDLQHISISWEPVSRCSACLKSITIFLQCVVFCCSLLNYSCFQPISVSHPYNQLFVSVFLQCSSQHYKCFGFYFILCSGRFTNQRQNHHTNASDKQVTSVMIVNVSKYIYIF